jgi:hypothetical protein
MSAPVKSPEGRRDAILAVRIPSAIKQRVEQAAEARGWSLSDTVIELLRRGFSYAPPLPDPFDDTQPECHKERQ